MFSHNLHILFFLCSNEQIVNRFFFFSHPKKEMYIVHNLMKEENWPPCDSHLITDLRKHNEILNATKDCMYGKRPYFFY